MEQIHQQTFDVRSIMILIGHHHHATIAQFRDILVLFTLFQTEDLLDRRQLLVGIELLNGDVADIQELASQREYTPAFAPDFL